MDTKTSAKTDKLQLKQRILIINDLLASGKLKLLNFYFMHLSSASYTAEDAKSIDLIYDYDPTTIERDDCGCNIFELTGSELYPEKNGLYEKAELGQIDRTYRWDYR